MGVASASSIAHEISCKNTIARLQAAKERQDQQLRKENRGARRQGQAPWPQGSRHAVRIQKAASERRALAKAASDLEAAEAAEREAELEAERQLEEEERRMAEYEAGMEDGDASLFFAQGGFLVEKLVTARWTVGEDESGHPRAMFSLRYLAPDPKRAARLQMVAER